MAFNPGEWAKCLFGEEARETELGKLGSGPIQGKFLKSPPGTYTLNV